MHEYNYDVIIKNTQKNKISSKNFFKKILQKSSLKIFFKKVH